MTDGDTTSAVPGFLAFLAFALLALALWFLMRHTPLGLHMRAVVDKPELAAMRGVNDGNTSAYAWVIGTVLAGSLSHVLFVSGLIGYARQF